MSGKLRALFWIGFVLLFLPYFGIPETVKKILTAILGVLIIMVTLRLKRAYKELRFHLRRYESQATQEVTHV